MVTTVVNRFLIWWLHSARYPWSRLRRWLCERGNLHKPLPRVTSLEDIVAQLSNVAWTQDGLFHLYDAISYPQTVWAKKKDDCDGFAILSAALLNQWRDGLRPVLITAMVRPVRESHTVCGFIESPGVLRFFDNNRLRPEQCATFAEIASLISAGKTLVCWDVADPDTLTTLEFHRA